MCIRDSNLAGGLVAVQAIDFNGAKRSRGRIKSGACYLGNARHGTIMVGESVMSVLSAWIMSEIPCCPVATMGSMGGWIKPPTCKHIVIAMDADDAGRAAALKLKRRMRGVDVRMLIPSIDGTDYNDWLQVIEK